MSSTAYSFEKKSDVIIPNEWAEVAASITTASFPPITLICGPKNSGKSTFSRILLNKLFERYEKVGYLDADVGQPEFSVPGCISFHLVDSRLSDLMEPCIKSPERCFFFGDISSKRDPEAYLNCIYSLYEHFLKEHYQHDSDNSQNAVVPLIVNTPGWVKGVGFNVLVEMLRYVNPTHVVQLRISANSKNLPTGFFWLDEHEEPTNLICLSSAQKDYLNRSVLVKKNSKVSREYRLFVYFKQCFPSSFSIETNKELAVALASLTPYEVPISKMKIKHLHCEVPRSELFHSLNATIVGLAVDSEEPAIAEYPIPWCVGLGIVRGVDLKKGTLYILTPVPSQRLKKVDLLLQGFVEIPTGFLEVRGCISPYMSANVLHKL